MKLENYKFVTEYLYWGEPVIAYQNAFEAAGDYNTLLPLAEALLDDEEVAATISRAKAAIEERVEQQAARQEKAQLLTLEKKRELLYEIATGQKLVEYSYKGRDCNQCTQLIRPNINQMLRAIHLDARLANHYPQHHKSVPLSSLQGGTPKQSNPPVSTSRHAELDSASGATQTLPSLRGGTTKQSSHNTERKTTPKFHNKTQQNSFSETTSLHPQ